MATTNTRERLIETATDLIWVSSYGSVSVDDICKTANVKKGSFYHYFPSKIDLALTAMDAAFSEFKPLLDKIFSPTDPPLDRLKNYTAFGYEHQKEMAEKHSMVCGCPMVSLASEMAPQNEAIRKKTDEIIGYKVKYFESALRDMIVDGLIGQRTDVKVKAQNIHAYMMGQFVLARIQNNINLLDPQIIQDGLFSIIGFESKVLESA